MEVWNKPRRIKSALSKTVTPHKVLIADSLLIQGKKRSLFHKAFSLEEGTWNQLGLGLSSPHDQPFPKELFHVSPTHRSQDISAPIITPSCTR